MPSEENSPDGPTGPSAPLMDAAKASAIRPQRFLELRPPPASSSFGLEVVLPSGLVVRGNHAKEVAAVARVLR